MSGTPTTPAFRERRPALVAARAAPSRIGPFRVLRTVARGGMAEVYEVEDPSSRLRYALKRLVAGGSAVARFRREYAAMSNLNHPNLARVYAFGVDGDHPWMTLELLDGRPADAAMDAIGPPGSAARTREVARLGHDLARALGHLHERGLVHRDIKPGNVIVLHDGRVKLIDFGIAYPMDDPGADAGAEFLGTLAYAAPEQFRGQPPVPASDLYATGALLYRLLTGQRVFSANTPADMAQLHLRAPPPRLRSHQPSIPAELERIVLRCLKKGVDARPASADALADELAEVLGGDVRPHLAPDLDRAGRRAVGREDVLRALATDAEQLPGGALVLVEGLAGSRRGAIVDLLLTEFTSRDLPARALRPDDPERFSALEEASAAPRRLVALLDLHKWDRGSLAAVERAREAARRREDGAVFVGELERGTLWAESAPSAQLAPDRTYTLDPLDVDATGRLVGALLHRRPPPSPVARAVHRATAGVPAFVEEVVHEMLSDGLLEDVAAGRPTVRWGWRQDAEVPVPDGARWQVISALSDVDPVATRLLEVAALIEAPTPADALGRCAGLEPAEVERAVARLVAVGLLHADEGDPGPTLRWRRPYAAGLVRARLAPSQARGLARRLLDAGDAPSEPEAMVRVALAAGRVDLALGPATAAARERLACGAPATALRLLEPVLARAELARETPPEALAAAHLAFAEALLQVRPTDPRVAAALAEAQARIARAELRAAHALATARHHAALARADAARRALGEAWTLAGECDRPALAAEIAVDAGRAYTEAGQIAWGRRWFNRAVRAAEAAGDPVAAALADVGRASAHLLAAELGPAHDLARDAAERFAARGDERGLSLAVPILVEVLRLEGHYTEALRWVRRFRRRLELAEVPACAVRLLLAHASVELDLGRLGWAADCAEAIEAALPPGEDPHLHLEAELLATRLALASGQAAVAAPRLLAVATRAERHEFVAVARRARVAHAEALAAAGRGAQAEEAFGALLDAVRGSGDALSLVLLAVARARALGERVDPTPLGAPVRGWPDLSRARAVRAELLLAKARWREAHALPAAEAWAEAAAAIDGIRQGLGGVERGALDVHRWQRALDRAGYSSSDGSGGAGSDGTSGS